MNVIEQIIESQNLTQKDLAAKIGVSPTQITKWKQGETIPMAQEDKLKQIFGLVGENLEFSLLLDNDLEKASAWYDLFESRYGEIDDFEVEGKMVTERTLIKLTELGVCLPENPQSIDFISEPMSTWCEFFETHSYEFGKRIEWARVYMCPDESLDDDYALFNIYNDIYYSTHEVALTKISSEIMDAIGASRQKFKEFSRVTKQNIMHRISILCENIYNKGVPLRKDFFRYFTDDAEELDEDGYFDSLGGHSIENFTSLSQREILGTLNQLCERVHSLEKKIESFLSK